MNLKTLLIMGAGVSALSLPSSAYILQSFEDTDLTTPNETRIGGQAVPGSGAFSTVGVTDGTMSYQYTALEATAGAGAKELIEIVLGPDAFAALAAGNKTLQWDTTIPEDDDPNDPYTDSDTFFTSVVGVGGGYNFYGSFNREDVPFDGTSVTTSYEFSDDDVAIFTNPAQTFVVLRFGLNSFEGVQPTAHFDNFRLVPEPASAALLGLGGLALLRRR